MKQNWVIGILIILFLGVLIFSIRINSRNEELYNENIELQSRIFSLNRENEENKASSLNYLLDSAKGRLLRDCIEDNRTRLQKSAQLNNNASQVELNVMLATYITDNISCIGKFDNTNN